MIELRPLRPSDDRSAFSCGTPELDRFFTAYAGQNQFKHHIGVTHVAVEGARVIGYATVAAGHIEIDAIPAQLKRRLPSYPLPVLRLARLAVDAREQGRGVGTALLRYVFGLAHTMAELFGCAGIVVDAKEPAVPFYEKLGFTRLDVLEGASPARPAPAAMFVPLQRVAKA